MTEKKDEKKMTLVIWLVAPMYVFDEYKRWQIQLNKIKTIYKNNLKKTLNAIYNEKN
jgi:hypothetical protein